MERAYAAIEEPLDPDHVTPAEKELSAGKVQTLDSKEKVPIAESTRKDAKEPIGKGSGVQELVFWKVNQGIGSLLRK